MNSMYFNEESRDLMMKFIKNLCDMSYDYDGDIKYYNDIHIKPDDCNAFIVEWEQLRWNDEYDSGFRYVDEEENQEVCTDLQYPDGHYEYVPVGAEEDYLDEWLDKNPGWHKDIYGHWWWNTTGDSYNCACTYSVEENHEESQEIHYKRTV